MLYNETNNFDEIKTLFPDKTEIEVVIRPCLPRADHRVPGGLILRKLIWDGCNSLLFIFFKDLNKYGDDKSTVAKRVPILGTESL